VRAPLDRVQQRVRGNLEPAWSRQIAHADTAKRSWWNSQDVILPLVPILFAVALIVGPLFFLLLFSLRQGTPWEPGAFTLQHYLAAYSTPATYAVFLNTAVLAGASTLISVGLALCFAFLTERTDMPFRNLTWGLMLIPLALPGLLFAISWTFLLSPKIGFFNAWLRNILNFFGADVTEGPLNIYSLWGMVFLEGLRGVTTVFLMLVGVIRSMDATLEEASSVAGASSRMTFLRVSAPLLTPAILAAVTYTFMTNLESLEIPIVIGVPAAIHVFPTYIYFTTQRFTPPEYGLAAALSVLLVLVSSGLVFWYRRIVGQANRFATITGKGYRPRLLALGKWRYPALALYGVYFLFAIAAPALALLWRSFFRYHTPISFSAVERISLANYRAVFATRGMVYVVINTIWVSAGAATLTMLLSVVTAWVMVRGKINGKAWLDSLLFLPHALPGVVIGIAFIFLNAQPPLNYLNLYGTVTLIVLGLTVSYIPFGSRTMNGAVAQLHPELEEAGQVAGSSWLTISRRIILPLMLPSFVAGWIWIASHSLRAFSLPLMLANRDSMVISMVMWRMWDDGNAGQTTALGVLLIFVLGLLTVIGRWLVNRLNWQQR
jgi:iron(III) transport system permease protein